MRFSAFRAQDASPTLNAILALRDQDDFSVRDPGFDTFVTSVLDDYDFEATRSTVYGHVRALDPEEDVLQDEWKKKGVLRSIIHVIQHLST